MPQGGSGRPHDPNIAVILTEMRDLRREAREDRRHAEADRRRSDERFEALLLEFRQDSARRETATQKVLEATQAAFRDLRTVGQSIVKTLNRHTRILERHTGLLDGIDRKLGARDNGRPDNGRGTA
jgi:hypothetical protein